MKLILKGSPEWERNKPARQRAIGRCVKILGGGTNGGLAQHLGVTPQAVSRYRVLGEVPAERVLPLVAMTGGRVRAHQLRPDLYPRGMTIDLGQIPLPLATQSPSGQ